MAVDASRTQAAARGGPRARLAERQREQLRERGLERLLDEIELPLVHVLREMEKAGIKLDTAGSRIALRVRADAASSSARSGSWPGRSSSSAPAAARRGPVRQARAVAQAPRQDGLLDRRAVLQAIRDEHPIVGRSSAGAS